MSNDLISLEPIERRQPAKIKTHFARIIVGGQIEKPCYSIMWFDPADMEYQIGYSSYELRYVQRWFHEYFEITGDVFENEPVVHAHYGFTGPHIGETYSPYAEHGTCSNCKSRILIDPQHKNFCPNCGAKMDKEEET